MSDFSALNIAVLAGGISHERDVSLRSGRRVADALAKQGHTVSMREPDGALLGWLRESRPDVVWPALHGASGEDGALRALMSTIGIPFVGALSDEARLAWHKPTAKVIAQRAGLTTPRSVTIPREAFRELGTASVLDTIVDALGIPVVVKPAQGGSAQGVTIVDDPSQLPRAMVDAYTYTDVVLIEQRIVGTEIAVTVVDVEGEPTALPAVEIEPLSGVYSFEARYNAGQTRFYTPARLPATQSDRAAEDAVTAHRSLGLRHISRIDFILDDQGTPWFLEANVLPGLTETSLVPQAIEASGRTVGEVYSSLAQSALAEQDR